MCPNHTASLTKYCICEYMVVFSMEQTIYFFFVTGYQEKLFVKMTSVLAQSTNKVRLANNEISHACFKTDENIFIKFWKVING